MVSTLPIFWVFVLHSTGICQNAQEDLSPPPYGVMRGYRRHDHHGVPVAFRYHVIAYSNEKLHILRVYRVGMLYKYVVWAGNLRRESCC